MSPELKIVEKSPEFASERNSPFRKLTKKVDILTEKAQKKVPIHENWITGAGVIFTILGTEIAEQQNRAGKHTTGKTGLALALTAGGLFCDLLDGSWARARRANLPQNEKNTQERVGQVIDPLADSIIELVHSGQRARTAYKRGDKVGMYLALAAGATNNLPRTFRALAGHFKVVVPETYKPKDVLYGDIRFFGTSFGRKFSNYFASILPEVYGTSYSQWIAETLTISANLSVSGDRLMKAIHERNGKKLSQKDQDNATTRVLALSSQSVANVTVAAAIAGYMAAA